MSLPGKARITSSLVGRQTSNLAIRLLLLIMLIFSLPAATVFGSSGIKLISPRELAADTSGLLIIDLRDRDDFFRAHVPGASSLPSSTLSEDNLQALGALPEHTTILYGDSEGAARKAWPLLDMLGFSDIRILEGGFNHWLKNGLKVETGNRREVFTADVNEKKADLEIIPKIHDFGKINKSVGELTTTFSLRNMSAHKVTVTDITTSCECSTAELEKREILPGLARTLTVRFDPHFQQNTEGKFSLVIYLTTSNKENLQAKIEVTLVQ